MNNHNLFYKINFDVLKLKVNWTKWVICIGNHMRPSTIKD